MSPAQAAGLLILLCVTFATPRALAEWRVAVPPPSQDYTAGKGGGGMALLSANGTTVTTNETEATPQIQALARALDNDPKLIYEYVRNHIAYDPPIYGLHNGANGCLIAGRGNDWDQAALLTSLLRTAGYTTRFGCGLVKYTRADLGDWLGIQADAVTNVVPAGGNPGGRIVGDNTNYLMQRVWVEAQIGGTWYKFDPAFKTYQDFQRPDLRSAMGYTESAFLTSATNGATVTTDYIKNANETNIGNCLAAYATNLVRYIQTNNPLMTAQQLIGGRQMLSETLTTYPTNLPKAISFWTTPDTWDNIPAANNVTLRIQHAGIDTTFKGYEIAAKRLSLYYDSTNSYRAQLRLAGAVVATGNATTAGTTNTLSVWVDHPYNTAGYCDTSNGFKVISGNRYVIMHDFESVSPKVIAAANSQLARDIASGLSTNAESVFAGGLEVTALSGLQQWHLSRQLFSQLSDVVGYAHHFIGIMAQESGYYVDIPGVLVGVNSGIQSNADEKAWFKAVTLFASALEHGTLEESQGSDKKCASTIKLLQLSNGNGKKSFLATSANWSGTVKPALINYTTAQKNQIEAGINAGHVFVLPESASITNQQWVGLGYVEYLEDAQGWGMGMIISGGYNGGYAGTTGSFNVNSSVNTVSTAYTYWPTATVPPTTGADPVDLNTGNLISERADIAIGNGPEPGGLKLSRNYNSGQNYRKTTLGYGWTHNYDIGVTIVSQGDPSFGLRRPEDATPLIAQSLVTLDLMQGTPDVRDWVAASLATKWGMDQVVNNSAIIRFGARSIEYVKLPDGSYVAPPGVTTTLSTQGSSFVLQERFGTTYTFNSNGTISVWRDADSNSVSFTYNSSTNLTTVSNSFGRTLSFTYTNNLITKVSDNASRSVSYTYTSTNLTSVLDPGSNTWTMTYDTNRCLVTMRDPASRLTISNTYDSVSKVQSQMNGASNIWNFYISGWRGVEEDPQGGRTIHYFDDDGRNLGTQDALSNQTYRVYDSQGHPTTNIDARGYATVFQYDSNHNVTNRTDALTNRTAYAYDSQFHLTAATDPLGNVTHYGYDSKHHVTNIVDALNNVSTMSYTSKGQLQQLTEGNGKRTATYAYDSYGNQLTLTRTDGGTISNQYDSVGNLTARIDQNSRTNRFTWDNRRLLTSDKDAAGFTVSNVYDSAGLLIKTIDRNGNTNQTSYTGTYKPDTITLPDGGTIQNRYDSRDWLVSVTDPLGHVTSNRFDKAGRKIAVVDAQNNQTSFALDPNGNVTAQTNALGKVTSFTYDALNRLIKTVDPLSHTNTFEYDAVGRQTAVTDADGFRTQHQFDALGRRTGQTKPDGVTETYEFDALNNLTAFVNGQGKRATFAYDGMARLRAATNAVGYVASYAYDSAGNRTNRVDANGAITQYRYDTVNNLTNITYPGSITVRFNYNGNRLATTMVDATGTNTWQYDRMNRITNVVAAGPGAPTRQVAYTYDLAGNRSAVTFADSKTVAYGFDSLNRVTNVTDWASRKTGFTYDALNRKTGIAYPNSASGTWDWDDANRLSRIRYASGGSNFVDRTYTMSAAGDIAAMDVTAGLMPQLTAAVQRFSQNDADELTQLLEKSTPDASTWTTNLYAGDHNGSLTNASGMLLRYDSENRLTNTVSGSTTTAATYDGQGNRVTLVTVTAGQTNVTWFVLDYADPLRRPLAELNSAGNPVRYFVWGRGLVAQVETNGTIHYFHADGQGSTLALTDNAGTPTDAWFYSPFGQTLNRTGSTAVSFTWTGGYGVRTDASGLYFMRHRYYHPGLMRYVSADPVGIMAGGGNLYWYANGSPLVLLDPYGLCGTSFMDTLGSTWNTVSPALPMYVTMPVNTTITFVNNYNYFGSAFDAANATFNPAYGAIAYGYEAGSGAGVSYYNSGQQLSTGQRIGSGALATLNAGATVAIGFAGASGFSSATAGTVPAGSTAFRYVPEGEATAAGSAGSVPNVDVLGQPRYVFYTTEEYTSSSAAQDALQIGTRNPNGATAPPTYRITVDASQAQWVSGGNVAGGSGSELITTQPLPVIRIDPLGP